MSAATEEAEWDTSKENFVPVKQGRPTSALVTPLSVRKQDQELDEAKSAFLAEIQAAVEDPLPAWLRYIKWTQEQYSTQASRKELAQVLEAATKALSSLKRYNNDVRLLRLWVQYADCLPDPSSVFLFLEDHAIGRDHALFYEAYAAYLELKGNFSQAELVYQEGVNRLAKPLERLKQKHAAFMQRMAKRRERQESEAALGMAPAAADATLARSTLAPLVPLDAAPLLDENGRPIQQPRLGRSAALPQQPQAASVAQGVRPAPALVAGPSSSRSSGRSSGRAAGGSASLWAPVSGSGGAAGSQQQRGSALLLNSLGVPGASSSSGAGANVAPRQLEVHVDEEFGPTGQGPIPTAFPPSLQQHPLLPGIAVATKENSSKPAAWAGTKLKQQGVFAPVVGPASNKLEVFEDEDSDNEDAGGAAQQQQQQPHQQGPAGLRQRLDAPEAPAAAAAGVGAAKADRLAAALVPGGVQQQGAAQQRAMGAGAGVQPAQASHAARHSRSSSSSSARAATTAAAATSGGPQGYSEALLLGPDGQELSFEEVRAAIWRQTQSAEQEQQRLEEAAAASASSPPAAATQQATAAPASATHGADAAAAAAAPGSSRQHSDCSSQRPFAAAEPPAAGEVSLHDSPAAVFVDAVGDEDSNSTCQAGSDNSASSRGKRPFGASAAGAPAEDSLQPPATAAAAVPAAVASAGSDGGVTINTRAAFDAMNGMFGGGDDTTTMHGFGRASAAAVGRRQVAAADAGGVTINTRAAFDVMNGMFGGGDDTTTMHGFGRASAAAVGRRQVAAADTGGVTLNTRTAFDAMNGMFGGGDDTTTMQGFARASAAAAGVGVGVEPTVTVNTRVAFDYMNGMFGGPGDVTMGQTAAIGGRRGARKTSRFSMAPAAAAASGSNSSSSAPLGIYEDTELLNPMGMSSAQNPADGDQGHPAFGVYEDTEFVGAKLAAAGAGAAGSSGRGGLAAMQGSSDGTGGFGLYEDTEFITGPVGSGAAAGGSSSRSGPGGGMGLYEDTDFLIRPTGPGGSSRQGRRESLAPPVGLGLYEDTDFITRPVGDSRSSMAAAGAAAGSGLSLYEDTEFITQRVSSSTAGDAGPAPEQHEHGLGLYEDTEFITRPVPRLPAATSAGNSNTLLLSKLNRLSLANEALYRGQGGPRVSGLRASRGSDENELPSTAGAAAAAGGDCGGSSSLGLYEDTEFLGDAGGQGSSSSNSGTVGGAFGASADGEPAAVTDENAPAGSVSGCPHQQQEQLEATAQGRGAAATAAAAGAVLASVGSSGSGSSILQQQHPHGYGGAGPSRFGPGSVPNSPGGGSRPGTAATTPGRPPRTPGTPGTGLGPLARHMDSFDVMESPAVHEALAGRPSHPGTAGNSPASLASSPGFGARENLPGPGLDGKVLLQPRTMADRAARAAALQPISASRAELLGVQVDPHATAEGEADDEEHHKGGAMMVCQSPGRALRSLQFGRQHADAGQPPSIGAPAASARK